ncbi:MAG: DUF3488 domain-containing protein [Phycisphaerales bacterium]|nr:MAG: DUF3488 domain-containing protein [Phycisphaerales bacterium]
MAMGIVCFFVASGHIFIALVALGLAAMGRMLVGDRSDRALPRWLLNLLVLVASAYAGQRSLSNPQDTVEYIGTLLAWVQVVKLYDKQTPRDHAQLLIMSVFTVIAACLTSNAIEIGVALALYTPIALYAILLHQVASPQRRVRFTNPDTPAPAFNARSLAHLRASVLVMTTLGVLGAGVVYLVLPRGMGSDMFSDWSSPRAGAMSGFTDEVALGRPGEITESQETVLDLVLLDETGRNIGSLNRSVLLRGATLEHYDASRGLWRRADDAAERSETVWPGPGAALSIGPSIASQRYVQRITIRNKQHDHLFTMSRPVAVAFDRETQVRLRPHDHVLTTSRNGRVTYSVESEIDVRPSQALRTPRLPRLFGEGPIHDLALEVLAASDIERDPEAHITRHDRQIARIFERYLQTEYQYDTFLEAPESDEDPMEMFLFRVRRGHCEYFAGAMAAMLRSVGIDARVVTGYRASEFNDIAGHYTVRQSNAHAWVEAQVDEGLWMTYDPSPPEFVSALHAPRGGLLGRLEKMYEAVEHGWITWVVGFDEQKRTSILGLDAERDGARFNISVEWLYASRADIARRLLQSALWGVIAFGVTALLGFGLRFVWRWLESVRPGLFASLLARRAPRSGERRELAFYRAALNALARAGVGKPAWRTPMTHADALARRDPALASDLRTLVELYYRERFAGRPLTPDEVERAQRSLGSLRTRLNGTRERTR